MEYDNASFTGGATTDPTRQYSMADPLTAGKAGGHNPGGPNRNRTQRVKKDGCLDPPTPSASTTTHTPEPRAGKDKGGQHKKRRSRQPGDGGRSPAGNSAGTTVPSTSNPPYDSASKAKGGKHKKPAPRASAGGTDAVDDGSDLPQYFDIAPFAGGSTTDPGRQYSVADPLTAGKAGGHNPGDSELPAPMEYDNASFAGGSTADPTRQYCVANASAVASMQQGPMPPDAKDSYLAHESRDGLGGGVPGSSSSAGHPPATDDPSHDCDDGLFGDDVPTAAHFHDASLDQGLHQQTAFQIPFAATSHAMQTPMLPDQQAHTRASAPAHGGHERDGGGRGRAPRQAATRADAATTQRIGQGHRNQDYDRAAQMRLGATATDNTGTAYAGVGANTIASQDSAAITALYNVGTDHGVVPLYGMGTDLESQPLYNLGANTGDMYMDVDVDNINQAVYSDAGPDRGGAHHPVEDYMSVDEYQGRPTQHVAGVAVPRAGDPNLGSATAAQPSARGLSNAHYSPRTQGSTGARAHGTYFATASTNFVPVEDGGVTYEIPLAPDNTSVSLV